MTSGFRVSVDGLRAGYGRLEALHEVSAVFPAGRLTALLGPNGAGKSTLLRVLGGVLRPSGGSVSWDGRRVSTGTPLGLARSGLVYVPQVGGVFDDLTVQENLSLFAGRAGRLQAALELFPVLEERLAQRAGTLSGGEHQMLALSRALLRREPGVVLVDEPGAGLAGPVAERVHAALGALAWAGTTVVVAEQYAGFVLRHASVVYVLRRGVIAFAGEPSEFSQASRPASGP